MPSPDAPPGCSLLVVDDDYDVVGTTLEQLRAMASLLGPVRAGSRHAAYTAWALRWSYARASHARGYAVAAAQVAVTVTRTLPRWTPVAAADAGLAAAWERHRAALALHEQGHVDLAAQAGRAARAALLALPPCPSAEALDAAARAAVRAVGDRFRAEERAYDARTDHGATQGCA
jgi:predicted secreted Zn-dependent protease